MKKLFGMLVITAFAASAFAQGTVTMQNNTLGWIQQWTSAANNTPIHSPVGSSTIDLLAAVAGTPLSPLGTYSSTTGFSPNYGSLASFLAANPGWSVIGHTGIPTVAGLINGGVQTIASVTPGNNAAYIMIGWTSPTLTLDEALASPTTFIGESALLSTATGGAGSPASPPVNLNSTFTGFTMAPIPEPTSFALAGLGLAALLVFRRRN